MQKRTISAIATSILVRNWVVKVSGRTGRTPTTEEVQAYTSRLAPELSPGELEYVFDNYTPMPPDQRSLATYMENVV